MPAKEKLDKINQMLTQELAGAESIKSRQTRQSVLQAITSTKESKHWSKFIYDENYSYCENSGNPA